MLQKFFFFFFCFKAYDAYLYDLKVLNIPEISPDCRKMSVYHIRYVHWEKLGSGRKGKMEVVMKRTGFPLNGSRLCIGLLKQICVVKSLQAQCITGVKASVSADYILGLRDR